MRKTLTILLALAMAAPVQAALPPHYQRQAEFDAVVAVATEALGIDKPIDAVTMTAPDAFEVRSGSCTLAVTLEDKPAVGEGFVGARQFEAVAGEVVCQ